MPGFNYEEELRASGSHAIAGIDEVGRGCWAGPVVAAAVVFHSDALTQLQLLAGIDDSKRLSPNQREALIPRIQALALGIGIGSVPAFMIDMMGIVHATRLAMELALLNLPLVPDALLLDALRLAGSSRRQIALIGGDHLSYSIAAASIIAKTARDRRMCELEADNPRYGFAMHKGYGTRAHQAALRRWGPCPEHRRSFRPLWNEEY